MGMAMGTVNIPGPGRKGIFAFDKQSGVVFEFGCIQHVMDTGHQHFVISDGDNIWYYDQEIETYKCIDCKIKLQDFMEMMKPYSKPPIW